MTEESLSNLTLDDLYDIMVRTIDEYLSIHNSLDHTDLESKRAELYLIQTEILNRKKENAPEA